MDLNSTSGFMLSTMLYLVNHNSTSLMDTIYNEKVDLSSDPNEVRCFGVYGCYSVTGSFLIELTNRKKLIFAFLGPWMIENRPQAQ